MPKVGGWLSHEECQVSNALESRWAGALNSFCVFQLCSAAEKEPLKISKLDASH